MFLNEDEIEAILRKLENRTQKRNQQLKTQKKPGNKIINGNIPLTKYTGINTQPNINNKHKENKSGEVNWELINSLPHNIDVDENV